MIAEYTWFERPFTFELPVYLYPEIIERLRGTPARLEERVAGLSQAVLTRREGEEWSLQENAGHLWDMEGLWAGRLEDFLNGAEMLRVADLTNRKTYEADHNARPMGEIVAGFRAARLAFVQRLETLTEADVQRSSLHPRLKQPMHVIDHAYFVAEHDDHHLAQITRLRAAK